MEKSNYTPTKSVLIFRESESVFSEKNICNEENPSTPEKVSLLRRNHPHFQGKYIFLRGKHFF